MAIVDSEVTAIGSYNFETYSAESKFRTDMTDLNTDIIVSLETYPESEQFLNRGMSNKLLSPIRYPNFGVKPVFVYFQPKK